VNRLIFLLQLGSAVVAFLVSRAIVTAITSRLARGAEQAPTFFTTPSGSALLFGLTFVVVWFTLSLLALLGWLTFRRTP